MSRRTPAQPLYLFTDNRAAIKAAIGAKTPWWCAKEAIELRRAMRTIAESRRVTCFWVPGHGGVLGNEVADRLARRGATGDDSDEKACPEDHFTIPKEELVVATALWRKETTRALWRWTVLWECCETVKNREPKGKLVKSAGWRTDMATNRRKARRKTPRHRVL